MKNIKSYYKPQSLIDAINLSSDNDTCFVAGGTDNIVNNFQGNVKATSLIDITSIKELNFFNVNDNQIEIGAGISLFEITKNDFVNKYIPEFTETINLIASPVIRKSATLGGNLLCENRCTFYNQSEWWREAVGNCLKCDGTICIATGGKKNCFSKFVSDTAVFLISRNARLKIFENGSYNDVALESIYTGNGVAPVSLNKHTIIVSVIVPYSNIETTVFKKLRLRKSLEFGSLTTAITKFKNGNVKLVIGCMDPKPVVINATPNLPVSDVIKLALKESRTVDNDLFSRKYRREMLAHYITDSFSELN